MLSSTLTVGSSLAEPRPFRTSRERTMTGLDPVVERAQKGDEAAFNQLFRIHRDTVVRVVYRVLGPTPEAEVEDVVQDVFIHVFRSLKNFRGDARFTTWLYRLTTNVARMHIRRKRSRPRYAHVEVPERADDTDDRVRPDEATESGRRIAALYDLVQELSDKKREVLVLHDFEGVPAKEIAEIVEAPVLTVRTRLFYARKELYARIAEHPELSAAVEHLLDDLPGKAKKGAAAKANAEAKDEPGRGRRVTGGAP